jgi:protein involved in polysaccharide export with SLBB domain
MIADRRHLLMLLGAGVLGGCGAARSVMPEERPLTGERVSLQGFEAIGFSDWSEAEPEYMLYPGDEIEVATPTAPELTRTVRVGPDGRIALPLIGQVMAADRTLFELESGLSGAYASQLVRPVVEISLKQAGPMKVWVAGEVRNPNVYDMPGDIDALQAVIMAGGYLPSARSNRVAVIRRGPGGRRMLRAIDLRERRGEVVALRRGDVVFVPRSTLGELANFFTQVKAALPIGFNYTINGQYQQF